MYSGSLRSAATLTQHTKAHRLDPIAAGLVHAGVSPSAAGKLAAVIIVVLILFALWALLTPSRSRR